jgi:hypothetical protein
MAVAYGGEGGCQDNALHACGACGAEDAESAFARGADEVVLVLRDFGWKRRGDVEDVVAAGCGFGPAFVFFEIGNEEGEGQFWLCASVEEHGADFGLARGVADGGTHDVASGEELEDGVAADEAGASGNEDSGHEVSF